MKWYGIEDGVKKYAGVYNLIDITSILIFVALGVRAVTLRTATLFLEDTVAAKALTEDRETSEAIVDALEDAVANAGKFRWYAILGAFTIMLRFFKAFDSQPRLSLVSRTFAACLIDVVHFLFVMAAIFTVFSIAAVVMFGHRVASFVTFTKVSRFI